MKKLTKVCMLTLSAVIVLGGISVFAVENKSAPNFERRAFAENTKAKDGNFKFGKPFELTEEEKTEKTEQLKTDLAAKLESGEISQEEYDKILEAIESGNFNCPENGFGKMKGVKPHGEKPELTEEEISERGEQFKSDLAAKLESGEISQEEYDKILEGIESGNFRCPPPNNFGDMRDGKMHGEKPELTEEEISERGEKVAPDKKFPKKKTKAEDVTE